MKTKKDLIIETATSLFAKHGFEKTSVAAICENAQVSKGLVYHHFKSKDEILIAIYEQSTEEMVNLSMADSRKKPSERLKDIIEGLFLQLESNKQFYQFNLNIMFQPSTKRMLESQIKERATLLFNSVKSIFKRIDATNSELLSYVFIAEIDGIALSYLSSFENYPITEMKNHLLKKYTND
ncbi:MAG: TetR/AcrR family transcriptional regulator [Flavobacteriaceae bacterium]|nr:TetR/AcrR family transcriptional regulator [Flavobacteriaceae bacterium]